MKKKGRKPQIPDFSSKQRQPSQNASVRPPRGPVTSAPARVIKPRSTSAKSGRRGQ